MAKIDARLKRFQSTLPGWGATVISLITGMSMRFQSTLPGWGATFQVGGSSKRFTYFNPRSPDGERPVTF